MLVRVTEQCDMGCTHCFINASPQGKHMAMSTFKDVLKFIRWTGLPYILISGGEPTQHPDIIRMIKMAKKEEFHTILISNGTFIEKPKLRKKIEDLKVTVQITTDPTYYPKKVPVINNPLFLYTHKINIITPINRAKFNGLPSNREALFVLILGPS